MSLTVGVLALQGGFHEHLELLQKAAVDITGDSSAPTPSLEFIQVRNEDELNKSDALVIPGGESTAISLVAARSGLLEPLRQFVKVHKKPTWGTCAGLILLSDAANGTKQTGQELIGGLAVKVHRNHFGRQIESFESQLDLPFLPGEPFPGVFIRAPVVEEILAAGPDDGRPPVQVLAKLPDRVNRMKAGLSQADTKDDSGDIIAVRQGNVLGTSFHPELTKDARIHAWWLREIISR